MGDDPMQPDLSGAYPMTAEEDPKNQRLPGTRLASSRSVDGQPLHLRGMETWAAAPRGDREGLSLGKGSPAERRERGDIRPCPSGTSDRSRCGNFGSG